METLTVNVKGWPDSYVKLLRQYAEALGHQLGQNGLPTIPVEDHQALVEHGMIQPGTQKLPAALRIPPVGDTPAGVLDALLDERMQGR